VCLCVLVGRKGVEVVIVPVRARVSAGGDKGLAAGLGVARKGRAPGPGHPGESATCAATSSRARGPRAHGGGRLGESATLEHVARVQRVGRRAPIGRAGRDGGAPAP
jgi:hypothetical protein